MERAVEFFEPALAKLTQEKRLTLAKIVTRKLRHIVANMPLSPGEKVVVEEIATAVGDFITDRVNAGFEANEDPAFTLKITAYGLRAALEQHQEVRRGMALVYGESCLNDYPTDADEADVVRLDEVEQPA